MVFDRLGHKTETISFNQLTVSRPGFDEMSDTSKTVLWTKNQDRSGFLNSVDALDTIEEFLVVPKAGKDWCFQLDQNIIQAMSSSPYSYSWEQFYVTTNSCS